MDLTNSKLNFAQGIQKILTTKEPPKNTIQRFIDDFELISGAWYWEGSINHKEMYDEEFTRAFYSLSYQPIPSKQWKTCADLMRAAYKLYLEEKYDAGKIIILTIDQWITTETG